LIFVILVNFGFGFYKIKYLIFIFVISDSLTLGSSFNHYTHKLKMGAFLHFSCQPSIWVEEEAPRNEE